MATNPWYWFALPNWTQTSDVAAKIALDGIRSNQAWLFGHLFFKAVSPGFGTFRIPGHTITSSGPPPEHDSVELEDTGGTSGYKWRANLTWTSGELTGISYDFDDNTGGGYTALVPPLDKIYAGYTGQPPEAQEPSDATDPNSFFVDQAPYDPQRDEQANAKAMREGFIALMAMSPLHGMAFQSYLITGYNQTITGDPAAPTQIDLDPFSASQPWYRYTFKYRPTGELWRILIETRRDDTQPWFVLDHFEYVWTLQGFIKWRRSIDTGAPGGRPRAMVGLGTAEIAFTPDMGSGQFYNWTAPAWDSADRVTENRANPVTFNWWFLLATLGYGGENPLLYHVPHFAQGYGFTRFFYANGTPAGDAGKPAAV